MKIKNIYVSRFFVQITFLSEIKVIKEYVKKKKNRRQSFVILKKKKSKYIILSCTLEFIAI